MGVIIPDLIFKPLDGDTDGAEKNFETNLPSQSFICEK